MRLEQNTNYTTQKEKLDTAEVSMLNIPVRNNAADHVAYQMTKGYNRLLLALK